MQQLLRRLDRFRWLFTVLGGGVLGVVLVLAYLAVSPPGGRYSDADIQRLADERIEKITPTPPREPEIFAMVRPSVVEISHNVTTAGAAGRGVGSGVVVDANGSILTAYHVVAGADTVSVRFFDGSILPGRVTLQQPERDLAVITVRNLPKGVEPATLSGGVQPGDKVLAIGAPFEFEGSVTEGVVSATGRNFVVDETGQVLQNMIQFDAAVNPGNSGGPLVDYNGNVVGIVTGLINPTGQHVFIGLGFAIPIEQAAAAFPPIF